MNKETFEQYIEYKKILCRRGASDIIYIVVSFMAAVYAHNESFGLIASAFIFITIWRFVDVCIAGWKSDEIDKRIESILNLRWKDDWEKFHNKEK